MVFLCLLLLFVCWIFILVLVWCIHLKLLFPIFDSTRWKHFGGSCHVQCVHMEPPIVWPLVIGFVKDLASAAPFQLPPIKHKKYYILSKVWFLSCTPPRLPRVAPVCFGCSCSSPMSVFLPRRISPLLHFSPVAFLPCLPIVAPVCLVVAAFLPRLHSWGEAFLRAAVQFPRWVIPAQPTVKRDLCPIFTTTICPSQRWH